MDHGSAVTAPHTVKPISWCNMKHLFSDVAVTWPPVATCGVPGFVLFL